MNDSTASSQVPPESQLQDLVEQLLGQPVVSVEQLSVDAYNAHYRIERSGGPLHMVRYFNTGDAALEGISFEHAVLLHLERQGFERLPRLVQRKGETIFRAADDYYAFSQWIAGCDTAIDRPITSGQVAGIARCMAELHRAMAGFDRELRYLPAHMFVFPAGEVRRQTAAMVKRLQAVADAGDDPAFDTEARDLLRAWLPDVPATLERFPWELYEEVRGAAAQYLVHGDLRLLNLVFDGAEVSTVLDFNASFNEIRLWDLCYTALSLAGTETLGEPTRPARAAQFLKSYAAVHPLTPAEIELLPQFLAFTVTKLMLAAPCSWWVVQRAPLLARLQAGWGREICAAAFADTNS